MTLRRQITIAPLERGMDAALIEVRSKTVRSGSAATPGFIPVESHGAGDGGDNRRSARLSHL
jgi:hypothetical protein